MFTSSRDFSTTTISEQQILGHPGLNSKAEYKGKGQKRPLNKRPSNIFKGRLEGTRKTGRPWRP